MEVAIVAEYTLTCHLRCWTKLAAVAMTRLLLNPVKRKSGGGGRPSKKMLEEQEEPDEDGLMPAQLPIMDEEQSCGLRMTTMHFSASRACDHLGCEEDNFCYYFSYGNVFVKMCF